MRGEDVKDSDQSHTISPTATSHRRFPIRSSIGVTKTPGEVNRLAQRQGDPAERFETEGGKYGKAATAEGEIGDRVE